MSLLDLPDDLLEEIVLKRLQCCKDDGRFSLFSLSRVHSRLHKATAAALRSIKAELTPRRQVDTWASTAGTSLASVLCVRLVKLFSAKGCPKTCGSAACTCRA